VDDSAAVRGAIRNFFETKTLYRCDEAGDGLSAIQTAEANHCKLVVLDLAMPNMNGVETASILRCRLPDVKIVGFSAHGDELGPELVATGKFDIVLSKRDGIEQLADVVKSLIPEPIERE
jgi:DNA-binding NarL/FixJ family response regulator